MDLEGVESSVVRSRVVQFDLLSSIRVLLVYKRYFCRMWDFDDSFFFMAERSLAIYVLSPR